jgi:hypothetical protein
MQSVRWSEKSYYQNLLYSRFASLDYATSKTNRSFGAQVPIGEVVMGRLDYSEGEFNAKRAEIEKTLFRQSTSSRELDVSMVSGDPEIIRAWSECKRNRGGLAIRFQAQTPRLVRMIVEYFPEGTRTRVKLANDVLLVNDNGDGGPDVVTVLSGDDCLKAGLEIAVGAPCEATLRVEARTALLASARTPEKGASAYLPPRLKAEVRESVFPFDPSCNGVPADLGKEAGTANMAAFRKRCPDRILSVAAPRQRAGDQATVRLTDAQIAEGYRFLRASARLTMQVPYGNDHRGNHCTNEIISVTDREFTYKIDAISGGHANASVVCKVNPFIKMQQMEWVEAKP